MMRAAVLSHRQRETDCISAPCKCESSASTNPDSAVEAITNNCQSDVYRTQKKRSRRNALPPRVADPVGEHPHLNTLVLDSCSHLIPSGHTSNPSHTCRTRAAATFGRWVLKLAAILDAGAKSGLALVMNHNNGPNAC